MLGQMAILHESAEFMWQLACCPAVLLCNCPTKDSAYAWGLVARGAYICQTREVAIQTRGLDEEELEGSPARLPHCCCAQFEGG